MKGVVIIAFLAFAAVQLCNSAPMPDEEKKVEAPLSTPAPEAASQPPAVVEVKSEPASPEPAAPVTTAKVEEKKP